MLAPFVVAHVALTRVLPLEVLGDSALVSSLQYVAHSMASSPKVMWATLTPLVVLSIYHVAFGWKRWLKVAPKKWAKQVYGGIAVLSAFGFASLIRVAAQGPAVGWVASQYDKILQAAFLV